MHRGLLTAMHSGRFERKIRQLLKLSVVKRY